ncbi:MAG: NAD(P)-dependent alcohol dehydrogenase [Candidatus Bathyarchaeota archaeon]|nr:NAD(P)-dependent alcohol dehydrogenase [Candidatus Bathyarchaeum sp.]
MKAIVYEKYGPPDVLVLKEVEKPTPNDNAVLVKVCAASVNVEDLDYLRGNSWAVRMLGPLKPKYSTLGFDVAGCVEAVGRNVKAFQPGDNVMGDLFNYGFGAFAEYVCAPEEALVLKPASITFAQASTVPSRAILALQGLCGKRQLQPGQKVLINGAGGGVGPFAVQIAKYFRAEVTAVDSTTKLGMLRSIGADHVIDYTQEDFTKNGRRYDLILDVSARHSIFDYKRSLCPKGLYVMVGGSRATIFQVLFLGPLISMLGDKKMGLIAWKPNKKEDLEVITELIESGKIVPVIDRCYPLNAVAKALRYFEEGAPKGKTVITVDPDNKI